MENAKQYSFYNLINGRHFDNIDGWIDTDENDQAEALEEFREFLLLQTRNGSKPNRAISRMSMSNLPNDYGIFKRLIIEDRGVEYTAGQEYTSEMKIIKDLIVKHCY